MPNPPDSMMPRRSPRLSLRPPLSPALVLGLALGCQTQQPNENCDGMTAGMEQDVCMGKLLKETPANEIDKVFERATKIRDPMVKGEAVASWVAAHANAIPPNKGQKLCSMLEGRDGAYCMRRLSSPHLQE